MRSLSINSNISSLKTQRQLSISTREVARVSERLSSGMRINNSSDDAAGLAISQSLNLKGRVMSQGIRNINDGISVLNIAESAVSQLSTITIRQQELATQAASGTFSLSQRKAMDMENVALSKEYNRIVASTSFNGLKPIDGTQTSLRIQTGFGVDGSINVKMGEEISNALWNGSYQSAQSFSTSGGIFSVSDVNGDGYDDLNELTGSGVNTYFGSASGLSSTAVTDRAVVYDTNGDGINDRISINFGSAPNVILERGLGGGNFAAPTTLEINLASGDLSFGDFNGDGRDDIIASNSGSSYISFGQANGSSSAFVNASTMYGNLNEVRAGADFNSDGLTDLVSGTAILFSNGDGSFRFDTQIGSSGLAFSNGGQMSFGDLNNDGTYDFFSNPTGTDFEYFLGRDNGGFETVRTTTIGSSSVSYISSGDFNGDGAEDIAFVGASSSIAFQLGSSTTNTTQQAVSHILTQDDARAAIQTFSRRLTEIGLELGKLGAARSRFDVAAQTLSSATVEYQAANSRIMSTDVASDAAILAREKIRQQVGVAILGQANQTPRTALKLLADIRTN